MAISYNDWKKQYDALDSAWKQKYADLAKNSALWQQYMNQYNNPPRNYAQTYKNVSPNNNDINSNMNNNFSESRSYYEENNNNSNQMKQDMMNMANKEW